MHKTENKFSAFWEQKEGLWLKNIVKGEGKKEEGVRCMVRDSNKNYGDRFVVDASMGL